MTSNSNFKMAGSDMVTGAKLVKTYKKSYAPVVKLGFKIIDN